MKNRYLAFFFVFLLLFSCGKVQEQSKPTFPEMRQTTIAGSGNYTLEFHADMPWMLLSSAPWVSFVDNGMKVYDISGYRHLKMNKPLLISEWEVTLREFLQLQELRENIL